MLEREVQKVWKPQIRPRFRCKLLEDLDSLTHRRVSKESEYIGIPAKFQFMNCEASQNTFGTFWLKRQPELTLFIVWGQILLYKVQPAFITVKKSLTEKFVERDVRALKHIFCFENPWVKTRKMLISRIFLGENHNNADILYMRLDVKTLRYPRPG